MILNLKTGLQEKTIWSFQCSQTTKGRCNYSFNLFSVEALASSRFLEADSLINSPIKKLKDSLKASKTSSPLLNSVPNST